MSEQSEASRASLTSQTTRHRVGSDVPFLAAFICVGGVYVLLLVGMLVADMSYTSLGDVVEALESPYIQYSIKLSLISCTITAILSLYVAVPIGYLLSRFDFRGKVVVDTILDIPIVLPPLVIGLSLLILFQTPIGRFVESFVSVTYEIPSVILAQFMVACAFAVRTMRVTFDQIDPRQEQVARTLGSTRSQAFWSIVFPQTRRGLLTSATLAWARSLGEFGPILVFSGATRMRTEVLSTSVFLELTIGNLEGAVAVSLIMAATAVAVLVLARVFGLRGITRTGRA